MNISIFESLGPVMIGPSSSHTAGADYPALPASLPEKDIHRFLSVCTVLLQKPIWAMVPTKPW
jgi:hypothetical protein